MLVASAIWAVMVDWVEVERDERRSCRVWIAVLRVSVREEEEEVLVGGRRMEW